MKTIALRFFSFLAVFCLSFLILASQAQAVCCGCNAMDKANTSPKQSCLVLTDAEIENQTDCTTIKSDFAPLLQVCDTKPLDEAQCKTIVTGGICEGEPVKSGGTVMKQNETVSEQTTKVPSLLPVALQFNSPIPGFEAPDDMGMLFASYIVAIYKYMISIGVFVATVMFIWGAFRYLMIPPPPRSTLFPYTTHFR